MQLSDIQTFTYLAAAIVLILGFISSFREIWIRKEDRRMPAWLATLAGASGFQLSYAAYGRFVTDHMTEIVDFTTMDQDGVGWAIAGVTYFLSGLIFGGIVGMLPHVLFRMLLRKLRKS